MATKLTSIDKLRREANKYRGQQPWYIQISPECRAFLNAAFVMLCSGELSSIVQMYKACTAVVESDFTEDLRLWPKITAFKTWIAEQRQSSSKPSDPQTPSQHTHTKKPAKRRVSTV